MPETAVAPCLRVNVAVLMVSGLIASLNVAASALLSDTLVAPLPGTVELTVGGVVFGAEPVVKVQT